jgi:hypothetical protein
MRSPASAIHRDESHRLTSSGEGRPWQVRRLPSPALASARVVSPANSDELGVWKEQHVAAAVSVVNLEQLGGWTALTRSNLNGAAVNVARL